MPRYAVIDIGSNSIRMAAAEVLPGKAMRLLASERVVTRLGELTYGSSGANNGNLITEQIVKPLNVSETFTYDAYNRIGKASEGTAPAWSQTYNYDAYGNRWVTSPIGFPLYSFTPVSSTAYNTNNRLTTQFNSSIAYDAAGNQTGIGGYTFSYDAEHRQYSSSIGGTTTNYTYDGESRRVMKATINGTATVYVYDGAGEVAAEYSSTPPPQIGTLYPTPDHLGSTRLETNELGAPVWYHDYLPFGEEILSGLGGRGSLYGPTDVDGTTHKFTGKERDLETGGSATQGLDYFGARYFSSAQGRFTSPDPVGIITQKLFDPQQWNMYSYVRNNPLRLLDPTGEYVANCGDDVKNCDKQIQQFEKTRLQASKSKDESIRNAAGAGALGDKNGVNLTIANVVDAKHSNVLGTVSAQAGTGGLTFNGDTNTFQQATQVTIQSGLSGNTLEGVLVHEGTHVEGSSQFRELNFTRRGTGL
jgi:RHS repeat-associated protein